MTNNLIHDVNPSQLSGTSHRSSEKKHYWIRDVTLTGDTRKIFVSNITVDESNSARVLIGCNCKPIRRDTVTHRATNQQFESKL